MPLEHFQNPWTTPSRRKEVKETKRENIPLFNCVLGVMYPSGMHGLKTYTNEYFY